MTVPKTKKNPTTPRTPKANNIGNTIVCTFGTYITSDKRAY